MALYVVTTLVFVGTAAVLFLLIYIFMPKKTPLEERLEGLAQGTEELTILEKPPTGLHKFLGRLGAGVPIRIQDYGKYTRRLIAAGIKKERLPVYMGIRVLMTILFAVVYLSVYGVPVEKDHTSRAIFTGIFAITGFLLPSYWLSRRVKKRQLQIFHDLPDVLDLMTVCVQAGLSIDAAMIKICEDLHFMKSPLIDEMKVALQETRAGKQRSEALRDMGERTMVDDLKALSGMLIQTERLGTSLAQALLVHADSLRTKRRQIAEEAAAKVAIKLLFPLVFFIFPALLVVILGPAVLRLIKLFGEF
jgi:tight adherence protein C